MISSAGSSATYEADGEKRKFVHEVQLKNNCGRWNELSRAVQELHGLKGHLEKQHSKYS